MVLNPNDAALEHFRGSKYSNKSILKNFGVDDIGKIFFNFFLLKIPVAYLNVLLILNWWQIHDFYPRKKFKNFFKTTWVLLWIFFFFSKLKNKARKTKVKGNEHGKRIKRGNKVGNILK